MKRPEYSELPWRVDRTYDNEAIIDASGGVMFVDTSNDTPEGAAEYIVHCVNTHDALRAIYTTVRSRTERGGYCICGFGKNIHAVPFHGTGCPVAAYEALLADHAT